MKLSRLENKHYMLKFVIAIEILIFAISYSLPVSADIADKLPVIVQELVAPPFLPKHDQVAKGGPKVVKVKMTVEEKILDIDNEGIEFRVFAFNGSVPGPIIVVHEGDYV